MISSSPRERLWKEAHTPHPELGLAGASVQYPMGELTASLLLGLRVQKQL